MKEFQIHATNINGLGAINVANAIIESLIENKNASIYNIYHNININKYDLDSFKYYKRYLPNSLSRIIEVLFSKILFDNKPTLTLGDIPLRGIENQILYVHQPNIIKPSINEFSSKNLKFKILRYLFKINLKYVKHIIVQTDYMKENLIKSFKNLNCKISVLPLPPIGVPNKKEELEKGEKIKLIYPASYYPHKNHDFLLELENEKLDCEIWLTLNENDFKKYSHIKFVKNLGILPHKEVIKAYEGSTALINLSNLESFCLPLVEAIYLDLPILTIDRDYSRWMCEDFGYYFNSKETFIKSLLKLENDLKKDTLKPLDKAKTKFKYSWKAISEKIEELI